MNVIQAIGIYSTSPWYISLFCGCWNSPVGQLTRPYMMMMMVMMLIMKVHLIGAIGAPPRPEHWISTCLLERLRHHLPHLAISVLLRQYQSMFCKTKRRLYKICHSCYKCLSKLSKSHGFVKVVTWICQSRYMYFSPNQTKRKFDKDFEAC